MVARTCGLEFDRFVQPFVLLNEAGKDKSVGKVHGKYTALKKIMVLPFTLCSFDNGSRSRPRLGLNGSGPILT